MAYSAITTAEIQVKKPWTQRIAQKVKDNFDYLFGIIGTLELEGFKNASFEVDSDEDGIPDGWTRGLYAGGSAAFDTDTPAHGAKAYKFTRPSGSGNGGGYLESDYLKLSELETMAIAFDLKCSASAIKVMVIARYFNKSKVDLSADETLYTSTGNYTYWARFYRRLGSVPSGARYCKIRFIGGFTDTDVAGDVFFDHTEFFPLISQGRTKFAATTVTIGYGSGGSALNFGVSGGLYAFEPYLYWSGVGPGTINESMFAKNCASPGSVYHYLDVTTGGISYINAQFQYITSSGEIGWVFILRDKDTGNISGISVSEDHPCMGNTGKPLLNPHPFPDYTPDKHEIIVINPSIEELLEIKARGITMAEDKPNRSPGQVIAEDFDLDELVKPAWPDIPVTVGLPPGVDWKHMPAGLPVNATKKIIPQPDYIRAAGLKLKKAA